MRAWREELAGRVAEVITYSFFATSISPRPRQKFGNTRKITLTISDDCFNEGSSAARISSTNDVNVVVRPTKRLVQMRVTYAVDGTEKLQLNKYIAGDIDQP
jgi:hypothetical protein